MGIMGIYMHVCMPGPLFSGSPKYLRDRGILTVLQAWFDESGKTELPVYLLAGYVGGQTMWEDFSDEWQAELNRPPTLPYLHCKESQLFKGWTASERVERILRFVAIIRKYRPRRVTFMLRHVDYRELYSVISEHPAMPRAERRMLKNQYYTAFVVMLTVMLKAQATKWREHGARELIEILFDEGIDRWQRLKLGFEGFVTSVKKNDPDLLQLLINKNAEFRDDKLLLPLQAADLLAWHLRRLCYELSQGNVAYQHDPVWNALFEATEGQDYRYTEAQWVDLVLRMHRDTNWRINLS